MKTRGLTPAHARFAREVSRHGNQSEAYRVAFPKSRKWKQEAVAVSASRLMDNPNVAVMVEKLRAETEKRTGKSRLEWLEEVARLAWDRKNADQLSALVQYGKAQGYYEPEKLIVKNEKTLNIRVVGLEERIAAVLSRSQVSDAEVVGSCAKQIEGGAA
jgi:hypothetical protein